jgi:hypothetical protein
MRRPVVGELTGHKCKSQLAVEPHSELNIGFKDLRGGKGEARMSSSLKFESSVMMRGVLNIF